jgi:cell division protein FtsW
MLIFEISYLSRYLFAIALVIFVVQLLRLAIAELRWDMKNRAVPVPGFFLMNTVSTGNDAGPAEAARSAGSAGSTGSAGSAGSSGSAASASRAKDLVRILPLFHTTNLGSVATSDIRIKNPSVHRRHAIIYLYDGDWFIRPASRKATVLINGVTIRPSTPLVNQDLLTIGQTEFTFVNERRATDAAGLHYQQPDRAPVFPRSRSAGKMTGAWVAANLFCLFGGLLLIFMTPQAWVDMQYLLGVFLLGTLILANLYIAILPFVLKNADRVMLLCLTQLAFLGILFQARLALVSNSTAALTAAKQAAIVSDLTTQGASLLIGLFLLPLIAVLVARTRLLEPLSVLCAIATPLLLILTLLLGNGADAHGATLWINIGGVSLQLTEFAKITYLIVLASFFKNRPTRGVQVVFAGWAAVVFFLILLLPDLGSAMILLPTTLLVYVVMTSEYWTTLLILVSGSGLGVVAFALFPHVQRRLAGWTSLWTEVNDSNRQVVYALQAIARGGLFGRGLGNGSPEGIPLASSDMVYAIVGEELGLVTALAIVLIFIVIWLRSARIGVIAQDGFTSSLALGIGTLLFMEAVIVIAGVTGLIPLTGATLPLIAKGGSSIIAKEILLAILIGLSARRMEDTRT